MHPLGTVTPLELLAAATRAWLVPAHLLERSGRWGYWCLKLIDLVDCLFYRDINLLGTFSLVLKKQGEDRQD
jgi:hypothetical protein